MKRETRMVNTTEYTTSTVHSPSTVESVSEPSYRRSMLRAALCGIDIFTCLSFIFYFHNLKLYWKKQNKKVVSTGR